MARPRKKSISTPMVVNRVFHATLLVTRVEEWCVEAETAEEARALLASGQGHACHIGERLHVDLDKFDDEI